MSSDGVDASDMMGNGRGDSGTTTVTIEDFDEDQRESYQKLIERGARYVRDGVMTVEECSLGQLLDENEEPSDDLVEAFHDAIRAQMDSLGESTTQRRERQQEQTSTTNPEKIDWPRIWAECNVEPNKPLSGTQLALAIDVSDQTPVTDDGADRLIQGAIEAGVLEHYPAKKRYKPAGGDGR